MRHVTPRAAARIPVHHVAAASLTAAALLVPSMAAHTQAPRQRGPVEPTTEQMAFAMERAGALGAAAVVQVFGPRVVIPIANKGAGLNGSGWYHRLFLTNPGGQRMDLRIVPSPGSSSVDVTSAPGIDVTLEAHETEALDWPSDALYPGFNVAYQIFNTSPNPNVPVAMVRIFNRRPDGTELSQTVVGHVVPAQVLRVGDKVRYTTETKDGDKPFRDNWFGMGLRDATQPSATRAPKARFSLYRADGTVDPVSTVQNFGDGGRRQWTPIITVLGYAPAMADSYDSWEVTCVGGMIDGVVMNIQTSGTDDGGSQQATIDSLVREGSLVSHLGAGGGSQVLHVLRALTRPGDAQTPATVIVEAQLDFDGDGVIDETVTGNGTNELTHAAQTPLGGEGSYAAYALITVSTPFDGTITRRIDGNIYANSPPDGTIVVPAGDVTVREGDAVAFAGQASDPDGDEVFVFWSFGDGGSSTLLSPGEHVFDAPGVHTVTLAVADTRGLVDPTPDTRTVTVEVNNPPEATIDVPAGGLSIRAGDAVAFAGSATDPDGDPVTVAWDFGDGSGSADLAPEPHVYAAPGAYQATFTATDSRGLADPTPDQRSIVVAANEPPDGTITSPATDVAVRVGDPVPFAGVASDPEGDPVTVAWDFGDGSGSADPAPEPHVYAAPGAYQATFTATDSFGLADPTPDTRTVTVTVNQPPSATITAPAGNPTIQAGGSVSFAGSAVDPDGDAVSVLWSFGDGATSTAISPGLHTYPVAGVYQVTLAATDSRGLSDPTPAQRTVTVTTNLPPSGTITTPAANITAVVGQSLTFGGQAFDPDGDPVSHLWSFGDGVSSTAAAPAHAYLTTGVFTVTYTVSDSHGLADPTPDSRSITVVAQTTLSVVQSQIFTPLCSGCHPANAGLDLRPGQTFASAVNVASSQQPALLRVAPGNPDDSYLYRKINGGPGITGVQMPRFGPPLTQAQRDLIREWILAGAPGS